MSISSHHHSFLSYFFYRFLFIYFLKKLNFILMNFSNPLDWLLTPMPNNALVITTHISLGTNLS